MPVSPLMVTGEIEGTPSELDRLHAAGQQGAHHIAHPQL
jgi:hypothetical protein